MAQRMSGRWSRYKSERRSQFGRGTMCVREAFCAMSPRLRDHTSTKGLDYELYSSNWIRYEEPDGSMPQNVSCSGGGHIDV